MGVLKNEVGRPSNETLRKRTILKSILLIIVVCLILSGAYFLNNKLNIFNVGNNGANNGNNVTTTQKSEKLVSKIDDTKDWVYDAEYQKNVDAESYSTNFKEYFAKDIVVPFINVNSSYVSDSNSEIKNVFEDAIKTYNTGVSDKITYVSECGYKKYANDNSLSVVLNYSVGGMDYTIPNYYTYNVNLKTGNKLSYEEIYTLAGFDSNNIDSKVEEAITKDLKERLDNVPGGEPDLDTYTTQSINNYKNSVSSNTIKYFLSDNKKLNVVVTLSVPAGTGEFDTIITVE